MSGTVWAVRVLYTDPGDRLHFLVESAFHDPAEASERLALLHAAGRSAFIETAEFTETTTD